MTDKKKQGFHEEKDALSGKSKIHSIIANKIKFNKENISKDVAIAPANNESEEKTLNLRFKDSNRFLDAVSDFEGKHDITIPLDFEKGSFVVGVSKEMACFFRNYMREEGLQEIPDTREIDEKIAAVQKNRSKSALDKDRSITAQNLGKIENPNELNTWLTHPNLSDLENIDTATEEKTISDRVEQK
jgi:hypothetical protein